jgi:hypothetical protein
MTTIEEKNRMIAEFMGHEEEQTENGEFVYAIEFQNPEKLNDIQVEFFCEHELKYHTSWDWLMSVVDKIYSMDGVELDTRDIETVIDRPISIKLEDMHYVVCQFIEWYNKNNKHENSKS